MFKKILIVVCGAGALIMALAVYALLGGNASIQIAQQTTRITAPLRENGMPDYDAYLREKLAADVTPENNAAVPMWQAVGPATMDAKDFQLLCETLSIQPSTVLDAPLESIRGLKMNRTLTAWLSSRGEDASGSEPDSEPQSQPEGSGEGDDEAAGTSARIDPNRLISNLHARPWQGADLAPLQQWMDDNQEALDLLVAASTRPRFFVPTLESIRGHDTLLILASFADYDLHRDVVASLATRAMGRLGEHRPQDAWQDTLACHRLARLAAQQPTVIHQLIARAVETVACQATIAVLSSPDTTGELADQIAQDLAQLAPLPPMYLAVDEAERFAFLDAVLGLASRSEASRQIWGADGAPPEIALRAIDWNVILQDGNDWYDRIVEALRIPDRENRQQKLNEIERDMDRLRPTVPEALYSTISRTQRSKLIGDILMRLLLPAMFSISDASDRVDTLLDLVRTTAALRRYRETHGTYPDKLDQLVPDYLSEVPVDAFCGVPYRYERRDDGFLLYSVGPDGNDDGGRDYSREIVAGQWLPLVQSPNVDTTSGMESDLVVRLPVPAIELSPSTN